MNRSARLVLPLAMLVSGACSGPPAVPVEKLTGATMGTSYNIKLVAPPAQLSRELLARDIRDLLEYIEDLTSTYRPRSELSLFNASPSTDWTPVSKELCRVIERALEMCDRTQGAFDITVGPLVNLWGFGPGEMISEPPAQELIDSALARVGYRQLQTRCDEPSIRKSRGDVYVDLSGWAKGYGVDQLAALLDQRGLTDYLVEIGGEMRVRGRNASSQNWAVAIEQPNEAGRSVELVLHLTDSGIATSGDYRNFFQFAGQRYSHTIDARTGWPVAHDTASVTVVDPSAAAADALATAMVVLGAEAGSVMAEELGIAGYFQMRRGEGYADRKTSAFSALSAP